jgi:RHS repeat-associated protein
MQRTGKLSNNSHGLVDDLSLSYNGNQLIAVDDEANGTALNGSFEFAEGSQSQDTEYWYDAVGSLGADSNKGISAIWNNIVALPSLVQFSNGNRIKNEYSFDGMKRRATYYTAIPNISVPLHQVQNLTDEEIQTLTTTDYCGNVVYENGNLKMILTEEGFITMENGAPAYHYYTKDHQGNNRMVVKAGNNMDGAAEQYNHYYPFGGVFETSNNNNNSSGANQPYKYNGKEFDRMYGLDWYDYSARIMDPTLGRFHSIDPLAEKYPNVSPYAYCNNNPISNIDPDGRDWYRHNESGNYRWQEGDEELEGYTNVGTQVSIQLGEDSWLNAYQNAGFVSSEAMNAFDVIASSTKLQNQFLGKDSPLSEQSKSDLFNGLVNREMSNIGQSIGQALVTFAAGELGGAVLGKALSWGIGKMAFKEATQLTAHGATRVAGTNATRGGVLSMSEINATKVAGQVLRQADGAKVYIHETTTGRYNVVVENNAGEVITTMKNWSQNSINRISKNYGWASK